MVCQIRLSRGVVTTRRPAMGPLWLRQRWPTRTAFQLCVMAGTVCIAVAALIAANPVVGLLGSTTFIVVSAFTVVFHCGRLLAFTLVGRRGHPGALWPCDWPPSIPP